MDDVTLSKTVAHALRHDPDAYGLTLDPDGWVELDTLVAALHTTHPLWEGVDRERLERMAQNGSKRRYEIRGDRIRAAYGHTLPGKIDQPPADPPATLYHGTPPESVARILADGLRPMARQYVHLSTTRETARTVGRRRSARPAVLRVDAAAAAAAGVTFHATGEPGIWLADHVPPEHLHQVEQGGHQAGQASCGGDEQAAEEG
jgi:putative RNA 2'-phosphotransferase